MRDIGTTARTLSGEDRTPPPRLGAWPWIPACARMTTENQILVWVLNLGRLPEPLDLDIVGIRANARHFGRHARDPEMRGDIAYAQAMRSTISWRSHSPGWTAKADKRPDASAVTG